MEKYHLIAFSGGKDSTAMLLHMIELNYKIDEIIFCDTYMEFPQLLEHVNAIKEYCESLGLKFTILKNKYSFEYLLSEKPINTRDGSIKYGYNWAGSRSRWCTSKLKQDVISKYVKELSKNYEIVNYVGIAYDEQYRLIRKSNEKNVHPLVEWQWTEKMALDYCKEKGYNWSGLYDYFDRVSCWCCPIQPLKSFKILYNNFPSLWSELKRLDKKQKRKIRSDYSLDELEKKFLFENEREKQGLSNNSRTKEYKESFKKFLSNNQ